MKTPETYPWEAASQLALRVPLSKMWASGAARQIVANKNQVAELKKTN